MLSGEVSYIEDDYYLVSPAYYNDVLEPYMDALLEMEMIGANEDSRERTIDPNAEYEFIDDPEDDYDEEALAERIKDMIENNKASSGDD